jgi:hypothetical protein
MAIRMLLVLDGDRFNFGAQVAESFSISLLVSTLKASTSPPIQVDTAHRRVDPAAMFQNFTFDATIPDLSVYDLIWIIGDEGINGGLLFGNAISDIENFKLATFMNGGGGVFATGDHDGIGSMICGLLPRVRSMRKWYAVGDPALPAGYPSNWPVVGVDRADTLRAEPDGNYYFDSQSDQTPQPLTLSSPTHPVLQSPAGDISNFPDHMHEGDAISGFPGFDFNGSVTFNGQAFVEYPMVAGGQERPQVIATGTVIPHKTLTEADYPFGGADNETANAKTIGTLSAYNGFNAGVGRVLTDSSFHHYLDINLLGDPGGSLLGGADTRHGFNVPAAAALFNGMKSFYVNTAAWLARPVKSLTFAIDKSTFGQDEVTVQPAGTFPAALFVIVDGLRPGDFPGGGISTLSASPGQLTAWAPVIPVPAGTNIHIEPTGVSSDDPTLAPRFQRFTFTYQVRFPDATAFNFPTPFEVLTIQASLGVPGMPNQGAQIELVKAADPFFDSLANGNPNSWLSSDLRVFPVVEGQTKFGRPALGSAPADAMAFITDLATNITSAQFDSLTTDETASAISILPTTLPISPPFIFKNVYNFALARVRLRGQSAPANVVRVFFRLFQSQTTASLTYQTDAQGTPLFGFRQTTGPVDSQKISLPGISPDGGEYISVPCFAQQRATNTSAANNLATQTDGNNVKPILPLGAGHESDVFFGCLLDNNLTGAPGVLPATPIGQANINGPFSGVLNNLPQLFMGAHQCLVAEIVYDQAPIINNSNPATSDKLAQRNIAFTVIENPGAVGSRIATHTFEIRATQLAIDASHRPDELMIDWRNVPKGSVASIYLPAVSAADILKLADRLYARHEISVVDAHTVKSPAGGITYIPIPPGGKVNHTGLFSLEFPAGVRKGQRFDVIVRQITTVGVELKNPPAKFEAVDPRKADQIERQIRNNPDARGITVYERVRSLDPARRQPILISSEPAAQVPAILQRNWRQVLGTFQIAIPVDVKANMVLNEQRLLSVLRWVGQSISPNSRWLQVFQRYLEILAIRVSGLGIDPDQIPPTATGVWPGLLDQIEDHGDDDDGPHHDRDDFTGKVQSLAYDHFGDFEGLILETHGGKRHRFHSREHRVHELAQRALNERLPTTVITLDERPHEIRELIIRGFR